MEVQRDGSLEKGSVDLVVHPTSGGSGGVSPVPGVASVDGSLINITNSINQNTINYNDPIDSSE